MKPVRAGKLPHWLKIYKLVETDSEYGSSTQKTPVLIDSRWGCVRPANAYKAMQSKQTQMPITHEITMRFSPSYPVTAECQIEWVGMQRVVRTFSVTSVIDVDERNRQVRVDAEERINNPDTA